MNRLRIVPVAPLLIAAVAFGLAACGPAQEPATAGSGSLTPVQDPAGAEFTPQQIARDVVGRVVTVTEVAGSGPGTRWTFEADEYRRVDILDRQVTAAGAEVVVFMLTRNNPKPGDEEVQVSGQLRLHYKRKEGRWALGKIENVSFRYSLGVAT